MTHIFRSANRQTGSALIVALIFLLLMTIIGTSAMQGSTMQERMSSNWRDWNLAFQSAEAALRDGERYLLDTEVLPEFANVDGLYEINNPAMPVWGGGVIGDGAGYIEYPSDLEGTAQRPRYYIEELASVTPPGMATGAGEPLVEVSFFRVTAIGFGGAVDAGGVPITAVTLSTIYRNR